MIKKLIPEYTQIVKNIENILGEKEREDFFRLKKVKDKKTRKKAKIKNIQTA
ncbi:ATP synthase subunit D domain protein [Peptoniphilus sp. BV3C26]|nr:ATP synthase subunit D domain protein [Peptoniphilus sp. BV3C26]